MKKDELVHLHSLLTCLRAEFEGREDPPAGAFARYDDLDVSPMAVYGSKGDHARAVRALSAALAALVEGNDPEEVPDRTATEGNVRAQS
jgi:hypothetical protein